MLEARSEKTVPAMKRIAPPLRACALARWYRERGAMIVLGGLHVLSCPDLAAPHAEALAIDDGVRGLVREMAPAG